MYKMKSSIRFSECDATEKVRLSSIINYFQDCTSEDSNKLGAGAEQLRKKHRAWVLNAWQVEINRFPKITEEIEVATWASGFQGVIGPRNFTMKTKDDEMLAYANSLWVYIDTETGRPVKIDEEEKALYDVAPALEMEKVSRKISCPETALVVDTFSVRKYHIDTNNHVNNSQYVQMACEVLPDTYCVKKLRVEYKKPAVYGDKIVLKQAVEDGRIVVELCDTEENLYAIVEFIGEN